MTIDLKEMADSLQRKLDQQLMSPKVLLGRCRLIDEGSRQTSAYTDPIHFPFYYHLGKLITPESMVEFGFRLGLSASCFLRSCKSVKYFLAVQEKSEGVFYSPRMGRANVRDHYKDDIRIHVGPITEPGFLNNLDSRRWDLALIDDEVSYDRHMAYLDAIWARMRDDGFVVVDHVSRHDPARKSLWDFSRAKNREPVVMRTRYGAAILQK